MSVKKENRIVVATVYQAVDQGEIVPMLNISPATLESSGAGDVIYLLVRAGIGVNPICRDYKLELTGPLDDINPFEENYKDEGMVDEILKLGTLKQVSQSLTINYTMKITIDNVEYIEDPKLKVGQGQE